MAISAYTGLPGSGKSYGVVENVILPALKADREVWTNIPLNDDLLQNDEYSFATHFEIDDIAENPNWFDEVLPMGVLLILDEVQLLWPSGLKQTTANPKHIEFLTKHRHLVGENGKSTEIVLLTQRLSLTANFVRGVIEKTLVTVNLAMLGTPKRFRVDIYEGAAPDRPNAKNKVRDEHGSYKEDIYKYYVSHTASENGAGDETRIDNRINFFGGTQFKLFIVFFVLIVLFVIYAANSFFSSSLSGKEKKPTKATNTQQINKQPTQPIKRLPPKKAERSQFLLEQVTDIYISLNQGIFPKIKYNFKMTFKSNIANVDQNTLTLMGYEVIKYSDCLVKIKKEDFNRFVGCKEDSQIQSPESNFFSDGLASSVSNQ